MDDSFGASFDFAGRMGLTGQLATTVNADVSAGLSAAVSADAGAGLSAAASMAISGLQGATGITAALPSPGDRLPDPYVLFRFKVEIDGLRGSMRFQKCSGPSIHTNPDVIVSGGSPKHAVKMPGKVWKWDDVTLTRGMSIDGDALWRWVLDTPQTRRITPRDVTVTLLNPDFTDGMIWTFRDAYPKKWQITAGPDATSDKGIAVESITFTHQGASVVFPGGGFFPTTGAP